MAGTKKVFLIYPPSALMNREDRCQVPSRHIVIAPPMPPTDLMYMAAVAGEAGCVCRMTDYNIDDLPVDRFIEDLKEFRPDYLVISATTPTLRQDLDVCSKAKETLPGVTTIAKGAHFLRFNTEVLADFPALDMLIRGETEATFREILDGKPRKEIKGLTWRSPAGPMNNPDRPYIEDLDSLPFPARHLVDNGRYVRPDNGKVQGIIKVARGCPFNCFFCLATPAWGRKVRKRSPKNILREIELCIDKYGIRDFLFWSDIFNLDRRWVMELCEYILNSGLKFSWATNTRVDTIDIEMATLMKKSGCHMVSVGIESGSQEILDRTGKKTDLNKIREAFRIMKKAGLETFAYYIIGLPWDTKETIEETIRLAIELDSDYANFFTATAFPGTRFFDYALENGLFDKDVEEEALYGNAYYYPSVRGHHLNKDEIVAFHEKAVRRFFFRPRYILKTLSKIRSMRQLSNYSRGALRLIKR